MQPAAILAALFLFQAPGPALNTGIIIGQVSNGNGTPAANVRVGAILAGDTAGQAQSLMGLAQTDNVGRYRLEQLPPGKYLLIAGPLETPAYYPGVGARHDAAIITIAAGAAVGPLNFKVGFVVRGKLEGATGPLGGFEAGSLQLKSEQDVILNGAQNENEAFEFRYLWPGKYQVLLHSVHFTDITILERDLTDLRLVVPTFQVSGRIASDLARNSGGIRVALQRSSPRSTSFPFRSFLAGGDAVGVEGDGAFRFEGVMPGTYQVIVSYGNNFFPAGNVTVDPRIGIMEFALPPMRVADIRIEGEPNLPIPFTPSTRAIEIDGSFGMTRNPQLVARSEREGNTSFTHMALRFGDTLTNVVKSEGVFFFSALPVGEYWLAINYLPPGWYVKSMTSGDVDLTRSALQVTNDSNAPPRIQITLTSMRPPSAPTGVRLQGRVIGLSQEMLAASGSVALQRTTLREAVIGFPVEVPLKSDGSFEFRGIPPGAYILNLNLTLRVGMPSVTTKVEVADQDLTGIEIFASAAAPSSN